MEKIIYGSSVEDEISSSEEEYSWEKDTDEFSSDTLEMINFEKCPFPSFISVFEMLKETKLPQKTLEKLKPLPSLLPEGKDPRYIDKNHPEYISKEDYSFEDSLTDFYRWRINDLLKDYRQELRNIIFFEKEFKERCKNKETQAAADDYRSWWKVCNILKFLFSELKEGEIIETLDEGKKFFHQFSKLSKKYDEKETEKLWENCKPKYGSLPYLFSIMKKDKKVLNLNRKELLKK